MSAFPDTPADLLRKLAAQVTGEDEDNWARFAELYLPAIEDFIRAQGDSRETEDVVQEVMIALVKIFRGKKFTPREHAGGFRSYLAKTIRNTLYAIYRQEKARGLGRHVSVDTVELPVEADSVTAKLDVEWAVSRHNAAVRHVLTKTLVSQLNKDLYRDFVLNGLPIGEVAKKHGVTKNQVSQAKTRIGRMIGAIEAELGD